MKQNSPEKPRRRAKDLYDVLKCWNSDSCNILYRDVYVIHLQRWPLRTHSDQLEVTLENNEKRIVSPLDLEIEELKAQIREGYAEYEQGKARPAADFLADLEAECSDENQS